MKLDILLIPGASALIVVENLKREDDGAAVTSATVTATIYDHSSDLPIALLTGLPLTYISARGRWEGIAGPVETAGLREGQRVLGEVTVTLPSSDVGILIAHGTVQRGYLAA